ncbi:MAG: hypothetical protein ACLFRU_09030 [Paracoccaceae bacterium]
MIEVAVKAPSPMLPTRSKELLNWSFASIGKGLEPVGMQRGLTSQMVAFPPLDIAPATADHPPAPRASGETGAEIAGVAPATSVRPRTRPGSVTVPAQPPVTALAAPQADTPPPTAPAHVVVLQTDQPVRFVLVGAFEVGGKSWALLQSIDGRIMKVGPGSTIRTSREAVVRSAEIRRVGADRLFVRLGEQEIALTLGGAFRL